jgi:hypothetical protein
MPSASGNRAQVWSSSGSGCGTCFVAIYNSSGVPGLFFNSNGDQTAGGNVFISLSLASIGAGNDFVWRVTHDGVNMLDTLEAWSVNGTNYSTVNSGPLTTSNSNMTGTVTLGSSSGYAAGTVAFIRWFSTILPIGSQAPYGPAAGDLGDWEFNNNGNDSSSHGNNLSYTGGSPSYTTAPTYAPACALPAQSTFRAGSSSSYLTSNYSFPLDGTGTLSAVLWQQIREVSPYAGQLPPSYLVWSSQTSANPTISGLQAGSYTIQLTVTQANGQSATCYQKYGAVAADANGSVAIANAQHAQILRGNVIASYANPWPLYETWGNLFAQQMILALQGNTTLGGVRYVDDWNTAAAGTVSIAAGTLASPTTTVTGSGTSFLSLFCGGSAGTCPTVNGQPPYMIVWYPIGGTIGLQGRTGRRLLYITACSSDTSCTFTAPNSNNGGWYGDSVFFNSLVPASVSNVQFAYCTAAFNGAGGLGSWNYGSSPANFYDNVVAFYARYYATGIDDYLYYGRLLADRFFQNPWMDSGVLYNGDWTGTLQGARSLSYKGLVMRAVEYNAGAAPGPAMDMWPGLDLITQNFINKNGQQAQPLCNGIGPNVSTCGAIPDTRENAYELEIAALDAMYSDNSTNAGIALAALQLDMQYRWPPNASNYFSQTDGGNGSWNNWVGSSATVTVGSPTVTITGHPLGPSYFPAPPWSNANPSISIWFTPSPASTLPVSNASGDSHWYFGSTYVDSTHFMLTDSSGNPTPYVSDVSCSRGTCSGIGYELAGLAGVGQQPFMVGIVSDGFYHANAALFSSYPAQAAAAATYALQNGNWMATTGLNSSQKGLYYGRIYISCEPPATGNGSCIDATTQQARDLNAEGLNTASVGYQLNGYSSVTLLTLGDEMMNAMFACPGDPRSDGTCIVYSDLQGYMIGGLGLAKWFGYFWGIGANWAWPSVRLGGLLPPQPRVVDLSVNLNFPSNAIQALVTVTKPDGTSAQVVCTASATCQVTMDAREGDHLLFIQYLGASSKVLESSSSVLKTR